MELSVSLKKLLDADKAELMNSLREAPAPEKARALLEQECTRLQARLSKEMTEEDRSCLLSESSAGLETLKCSCDFLRTVKPGGGRPVSEKPCQAESEAVRKKNAGLSKFMKALFFILLAAGLTLAVILVILLAAGTFSGAAGTAQGSGGSGVMPAVMMLCLGLVCLLGAGFVLFRLFQPLQESRLMTGSVPTPVSGEAAGLWADPEELWDAFRNAVTTIDQQMIQQHACYLDAKRRASEQSEGSPLQYSSCVTCNNGVTEEELGLLSGFLEAAYGADAQAALDATQGVRSYLSQKGIEIVDYSEEHADWFELLSADTPEGEDTADADGTERRGTIRPALVRDGQVLYRGKA